MQITYSTEQIGSFGGLNFLSKEINRLKLDQLIDNHLGTRSERATYSYSDIIKNLWFIFFSGGDCAQDIEDNLKTDLEQVPNLKVCSADTLARVQKSLCLPKEIYTSKSNTEHEFSKHDQLNELNLKLLLQTGCLEKGKYYDFDYDNQFIACEKYDTKKSYKMKNGYFPGVSTIGSHIVHFENRNGNSNVKYKQAQTLESAYRLLAKENIKVNRSRMDCGSFSKEIISMIEKYSKIFYVRAQRCGELSEKVKAVQNWQKVIIANREVEVCSINYAPFGETQQYRYVVSREKNKTGQTDIEFQDSFIYRAIMTSDKESTPQQVIEYYNQRGAAERIFDEMNNDFGWKKLPFSFMEENTVYMIIMAMCRNFFLYLIKKISVTFPSLQSNFRLKKFIFRFVIVPFKWVTHARQKKLKLYTSKSYGTHF